MCTLLHYIGCEVAIIKFPAFGGLLSSCGLPGNEPVAGTAREARFGYGSR